MKKHNQVVQQVAMVSQTHDHKIEVNSTDADAVSVSNYQYESRLQDKKRQIKLVRQGIFKSICCRI